MKITQVETIRFKTTSTANPWTHRVLSTCPNGLDWE